MPRIAFVGPAYKSQSVIADCQTCMNFYLENVESGQGKSAAILANTPGLNLLYNLGAVPTRGEIETQGRAFCVSGINFFELLPPNQAPNFINRGQIVSDGAPVTMAGGPTQILIASAGHLYCYQLIASATQAANTLFEIAPSDGTNELLGTPLQIQYLLGAFYLLVLNSLGNTQIQQSALLDGSLWPAVAQTGVEVFSDNVVAIFEDHLRLWVFGPKKTQPYFDAGDFPFALEVEDGALIEQGLAAAKAVCKADNSIFWLAQSETGGYTVRRANGYTPVRVSTHALEFEIANYATVSDCVMYSYQEAGHEFVVVRFPSAKKTWVYDAVASAQSGQPVWHQRGFWNGQTGTFDQSRAGFHMFGFGMHLVGDPTTGAVYQQSLSVYTDFGNAIVRRRRAPHISSEQRRIIHNRLQVDVEVGLGTFQGQAAPTIIPMVDAAGAFRQVKMGEGGILEAPLYPAGDVTDARTLFLNDSKNTTSWQVTISAVGQLTPTQLADYDDSLSLSIPFVTALGKEKWGLAIENLGGGIAVLQTVPMGMVGRGPIMTLRWSNDGSKTFSNPYDRDCGQTGQFLARVKWDRLGQARDRVYEISVSDPIPWRIIDAYLFTDEDAQPQSRLVREYAKRA
ncbi:MAG: hypothetical protein ACRD20_20460 [Terriglobales bacterium]